MRADKQVASSLELATFEFNYLIATAVATVTVAPATVAGQAIEVSCNNNGRGVVYYSRYGVAVSDNRRFARIIGYG